MRKKERAFLSTKERLENHMSDFHRYTMQQTVRQCLDPATEPLFDISSFRIVRKRIKAIIAPFEVVGRNDRDIKVWGETNEEVGRT